MSYLIDKSERLGTALKRVAADEIERAREALTGTRADGRRNLVAVHEARRSFKKARGVLQLARKSLGGKQFRQENGFFRTADREIRAARDGEALVETLDALTKRIFKNHPPAVVKELRLLLARDCRMQLLRIATEDARKKMERKLDKQLGRVKDWDLKQYTVKDARVAVRRAWRRCQRAFRAAHENPADDEMHTWRKRAKDLWHEMRLVRDQCPDLAEHIEEVALLTGILGEDRDLAMLEHAVLSRKDGLKFPAQIKMLLDPLAARRKRLRVEAFALAERDWGWTAK